MQIWTFSTVSYVTIQGLSSYVAGMIMLRVVYSNLHSAEILNIHIIFLREDHCLVYEVILHNTKETVEKVQICIFVNFKLRQIN